MTARFAGPIRFRASLFTLIIAVVCLAPAESAAGAGEARISGRVVDPQGHAVPAATVILTGLTLTPRATRADDTGAFVFDGVPEGRYDITASAPGLIGEMRAITAGAAPDPITVTLRVSAVSETMIVSAAQIDQPLSRVADSVTLISAEEIAARQLSSLGDVLSTVPGLTVTSNGGPGTLTSVFPRGGESDFTLVLVDGIRANTFGGGVDLSQVPVADVERVEIVQGPQSAIFGADAIGGVVQVITRQATTPDLRARLEAGSRDTRRADLSSAGGWNGWQWQAGANRFQDEGFTGTAPANGERVSNDDALETQGWLGGGYRFARGTHVRGTMRHLETERGAPGPFGSDPARRFFGVDRLSRGLTDRDAGGVRLEHPWTGPASRVRQRIEWDAATYDLHFCSDPANGCAEGTPGVSTARTQRSHGRVQTDVVADAGISASAGVEWTRERATSTFITAGGTIVPVERRVIGTFGEARWAGERRLSLQGGVRAEHVARNELAGNGTSRPPFPRDAIVSINPKVSVNWLVSRALPGEGARHWTRMHAAAGTGIRPPDAFEIAFTDNPALRPERSRSVEAGVSQAFAAGAIHADVTAFFNQYDDLIIAVGRLSGVSRYRTDNISNARARGMELGGRWRTRSFALAAGYTWLDTEIRAVDGLEQQAPLPYRVGDALLRRPRHQGSVNATWFGSRATLFLELRSRGATLDAEPSFGPTGGLFTNPGRAVTNAGGSIRPWDQVEIYARVLNLFDRAYEEVLGYPAPGRTAFAGVRIALR